MEDDHNFHLMEYERHFLKMEDDLNFSENVRLPHFKKMEDDLNFVVNNIIMQPETFKIKTIVVAPLWVT